MASVAGDDQHVIVGAGLFDSFYYAKNSKANNFAPLTCKVGDKLYTVKGNSKDYLWEHRVEYRVYVANRIQSDGTKLESIFSERVRQTVQYNWVKSHAFGNNFTSETIANPRRKLVNNVELEACYFLNAVFYKTVVKQKVRFEYWTYTGRNNSRNRPMCVPEFSAPPIMLANEPWNSSHEPTNVPVAPPATLPEQGVKPPLPEGSANSSSSVHSDPIARVSPADVDRWVDEARHTKSKMLSDTQVFADKRVLRVRVSEETSRLPRSHSSDRLGSDELGCFSSASNLAAASVASDCFSRVSTPVASALISQGAKESSEASAKDGVLRKEDEDSEEESKTNNEEEHPEEEEDDQDDDNDKTSEKYNKDEKDDKDDGPEGADGGTERKKDKPEGSETGTGGNCGQRKRKTEDDGDDAKSERKKRNSDGAGEKFENAAKDDAAQKMGQLGGGENTDDRNKVEDQILPIAGSSDEDVDEGPPISLFAAGSFGGAVRHWSTVFGICKANYDTQDCQDGQQLEV